MAWVEAGEPGPIAAGLRGDRRDGTVVARAPGRVNLIGEHTDYNAGLCLPVALPHATYAAATARADRRVRIVSGLVEQPWEGDLDAIAPGAVSGWAAYPAGVLWALREQGWELPGVDLAVESTVPFGAGLSSSAAIECAVAVALASLTGHELDVALRERLAKACVRAETDVAGAPTGGMDQRVSLLAEPRHALLLDFRDGSRSQVPWARDAPALLVIDTRVSHALVDGGYASRRADCEAAAAALGLGSLREATLDQVEGLADARHRARARHVVSEIARVEAAVSAISTDDFDGFGQLMRASHASLRDDFEVSCDELDLAVGASQEAGAIGARMTGGGFGGSAIALVPADRVDAVAAGVLAAFERHGYGEPGLLLVTPSAGASVLPV